MRIGFLADASVAKLDWAHQHGFGSVGWMGFSNSPAAPPNADWKPFAETFAAAARERGIRVSAIGAYYKNPLDPAQTDGAHSVFRRAIEVAAHIGVKTVSGFAGGVIEVETNSRGGNPVYTLSEKHLPAVLKFWEPLADLAAGLGVRLAFENCPMAPLHLPVMGFNLLAQPAMWERLFDATRCENLGLEWDPSHLICQWIDPVANLHRFSSRVFHVHAKDALIDRPLLERYGLGHPGVTEHRFPGFGQANWAEIIHALVRAGYDSDLNIEGWHDPVFRDHPEAEPGERNPLAGRKLEEAGLLIAKRTLEQFVPREDGA